MRYYEVLIADGRYRGEQALTYSHADSLLPGQVVSVPLRGRVVSGFIRQKVGRPNFETRPIAHVLSKVPLPRHCLALAGWISDYYAAPLSDALRLFAPAQPIRRAVIPHHNVVTATSMALNFKDLTDDQRSALEAISDLKGGTVLLHGDTATGKTEVYMRLAEQVLASGRSVLLLTPEIGLSPRLAHYAQEKLGREVVLFHSHLGAAERKRLWLRALESSRPQVVVGPRSALFVPLPRLGLIVVDESHEPAYKQEQSPRYHAVRTASKLAELTGSKVVLGSATPDIVDYYLAGKRGIVCRMTQVAAGQLTATVRVQLVDLKDRSHFSRHPYLSHQLLSAAAAALARRRQVLVYLNRRGTARLVLCVNCGWQLLCPRCDVPLTYHGDAHLAVCHGCGHRSAPPSNCPTCGSSEVLYKSVGTKAVAEALQRFFPEHSVARFDGDNASDERLEQRAADVIEGKVDIIVGTQVMAKGFDLPRLGMVGVVIADTSLFLPDWRADERTYQLLAQVIGRVGRGHTSGEVVVQSYQPDNPVIKAAAERDWQCFYDYALSERKQFRFPPFIYLLKLVCKRSTENGAKRAARRMAADLARSYPDLQINGPAPSFHARRGGYYYYQIVIKSPRRAVLAGMAKDLPAGWQAELDPLDLL